MSRPSQERPGLTSANASANVFSLPPSLSPSLPLSLSLSNGFLLLFGHHASVTRGRRTNPPQPLLLDAALHLELLLLEGDAELGAGAEPLALAEEDEGDDAHDRAEPRQQAAGAADPQPREHGRRGQGQHDGEDGPARAGRRVGARCEDLVRVRQVVHYLV